MKKNKRPPQAAIDAAKRVLEYEAYLQAITPICKAIEKSVFEKAPIINIEGGHAVQGWEDFEDFENFTDEQFKVLNAAFDIEYKAAGFEVESGCSPRLIADNQKRLVLTELTQLMYDFFSLDSAELRNPHTRNKLIYQKQTRELCLNYAAKFIE